MDSSFEIDRMIGAVTRVLTQGRRDGSRRKARRIALLLAVVLVLLGWGLSTGEASEGSLSSGTDVVPAAMADLEAEIGATVHLPVPVNERVEYWMRRYLENEVAFSTMIAREGRYAEMIRSRLSQRGMPQELVYLAAIESGFTPGARSHVSATGMWQFMGPTARAYGLRVDEYVDERRDPVRATEAALDYLQTLHTRYGSWYLAAAAYNAGPTRVSRALRRHAGGRTGDEALYWEIIDHLPRETAEFVPKILAASQLASNAERYGLPVIESLTAYEYDVVWVPGRTTLASVAQGLETAHEVIAELNPHLVRGLTPPATLYGLRVPVGMASRAVAALSPRVASALTDD